MKKQFRKSIDKILVESIKFNHSIYAWKSLNGVVEKCEMKIKAFRKEHEEIELEIVATEVKKISDVLTGDRALNFYIPELGVSFSTFLKKTINEKMLKINLPYSFESTERRMHERVEIDKGFLVTEINKQNYKKQLFDLSLGGFSIVLPRMEKLIIKKGAILSIGSLELGAFKLKIQAECISVVNIDRFTLESLPYGGQKLAFRITSISTKDREILGDVITTEIILNKRLKGA